MTSIIPTLVKILTALSFVGLLVFTVWCATNGYVGGALTAALCAAAFGWFTYKDVTRWLKG